MEFLINQLFNVRERWRRSDLRIIDIIIAIDKNE